jgi:hypothetical protein
LPAGNKSGVKFHDLNGNHNQDAGEPGLIGWTIHVFDRVSKALVASTVTVAANPLSIPPTPDGFYSFTLPVGDYTVCEALQTGWTQTAPSGFFPVPAGETLADCTTYTNGGTITPGPTGYNFTIVGAEVHANNDFGNVMQGRGTCLKFPNLVTTNTFNLNSDPTQIQKIIDAAHAGDVILLLPQNGVKTESITINKRIQLIGCSTTLNAATVGAPVVTITVGREWGRDEGCPRDRQHGGRVQDRGLQPHDRERACLQERDRLLDHEHGQLQHGDGRARHARQRHRRSDRWQQQPAGHEQRRPGQQRRRRRDQRGRHRKHGEEVHGQGQRRQRLQGRGRGDQNVLSENKAYSNGLNGYLILGNDTKMSKNIAGDTGTGNAGDGIRVVGNGGDISENTSKSNTLVGIRVTGTRHKLTKNKSGGTVNQNNGSCQYVAGASNSNGGSNTSSNNATFNFTAAGANSATGCVPAPPTP